MLSAYQGKACQLQGRWRGTPTRHTASCTQRSPRRGEGPVVFHFFIFEQGTLHCHFVLSPTNHAGGLEPNTVLSIQDMEIKQTSTLRELHVSILRGKQVLHNKQDIQGKILMCLFYSFA